MSNSLQHRYVVEILEQVDLRLLEELAAAGVMELKVVNGYARCGFNLYPTKNQGVQWQELSKFIHYYLHQGVRLRSRRSGVRITNDGNLMDDLWKSKAYQDARHKSQMLSLPKSVLTKIQQCQKLSERHIEAKKHSEALESLLSGLDLIPDPIENWVITAEILGDIGQLLLDMGHYQKASNAFSDAMHCPGAIGNPELHLYLGICQFELGDNLRAADELTRAYMGAGKQIFSKQDPKYFEFLKSKIRMPLEGW